MTLRRIAALVFLAGFVASPAPALEDNPEKKLSPDARGRVYSWKAKDGLAYEYFIPKDYDEKKGANLTIVLHGSNLDRRWTFWNHAAGKFREDDVVVSPDGTTSNGSGGFNFLGEPKDVARLKALVDEIEATLVVKQTFLYGHSQGSFFSFHYAGEHPGDVDGICADASGAWGWSKAGSFGHGQAIGILHGMSDSVVPYGQSRGAYEHYRKAGYPLVHLRTLRGWDHPPEPRQAGFVLAWCEGMTSSDPERVANSLSILSEGLANAGDFAAAYAVATRLAGAGGPPLDGASAARKAEGAKVAKEVDALATRHADAIRKAAAAAGQNKSSKGEAAAWTFHLARFLDDFDGVPAREALAKEHAALFEKHDKEAEKRLRVYYQKRDKSPAEAFEEGAALLRDGYLSTALPTILPQLAEWEKKAKELKIGKTPLAAYGKALPAYEKASEAGSKAFLALNR